MGDKANTRTDGVPGWVPPAVDRGEAEPQADWPGSTFDEDSPDEGDFPGPGPDLAKELKRLDQAAELYEEMDDEDLTFQIPDAFGFNHGSWSES